MKSISTNDGLLPNGLRPQDEGVEAAIAKINILEKEIADLKNELIVLKSKKAE